MRNLVLLASLLFVAQAHAGSIWQYTFTDELGIQGLDGQQIRFSFSEPDPLVIDANGSLLLHASDMSNYTIPQGDAFEFVDLSWMWNGEFRVTWEYTGGGDDKAFEIPNLATEGVWADPMTMQATWTIHDPPAVAPEPASWGLLLVGLAVMGAFSCKSRNTALAMHPT